MNLLDIWWSKYLDIYCDLEEIVSTRIIYWSKNSLIMEYVAVKSVKTPEKP